MLRPVRPFHPLLGAPYRKLPAHFRLRLYRMPPGAQRERVQGAAEAAGKSLPVGKNACAIDDSGASTVRIVTDAVVLEDLQLAVLGDSHVAQLPICCGELAGNSSNAFLVGPVGEEGAVGATADAGAALFDPVTATSEYARPSRTQPGEVGPNEVVRIVGIDELDPFPREVERNLGRHRFPGSSREIASSFRGIDRTKRLGTRSSLRRLSPSSRAGDAIRADL